MNPRRHVRGPSPLPLSLRERGRGEGCLLTLFTLRTVTLGRVSEAYYAVRPEFVEERPPDDETPFLLHAASNKSH
jgi:hypothetical protein